MSHDLYEFRYKLQEDQIADLRAQVRDLRADVWVLWRFLLMVAVFALALSILLTGVG